MAIEKQRTNVWICPKCNRRETQPTLVKEVAHRCPMVKGNKMTAFVKKV